MSFEKNRQFNIIQEEKKIIQKQKELSLLQRGNSASNQSNQTQSQLLLQQLKDEIIICQMINRLKESDEFNSLNYYLSLYMHDTSFLLVYTNSLIVLIV
jgi:hypothetical protein